jgi:hypothetical protein
LNAAKAALRFRVVFSVAHKHADSSRSPGLLPARNQRPCHCRATEKGNEMSTSHVHQIAPERRVTKGAQPAF